MCKTQKKYNGFLYQKDYRSTFATLRGQGAQSGTPTKALQLNSEIETPKSEIKP
jgi:hypothetical protein